MFAKINAKNAIPAMGWLLLIVATAWTGMQALRPPVDSRQPVTPGHADSLPLAAAVENGFELAGGSWQFPELNWKISQRLTTATPTDWLQEHDFSVAVLAATQTGQDVSPPAPTELDEQILALVRSLMLPAAAQGDQNIYTLETAGLRGLAISSLSAGSEQLLAICLQWPAEAEQWTQLELERLPNCPRLQPVTAFPPGVQVTAQRSDRDGRVQVQVLDLSQSPRVLQRHLEQSG